ncbi:MAG: DUF5995 family protein [Tumebacillaceae bacterium]
MHDLKLGGAQTIDEVIAQMDQIIAWSIAEGSRLGYFAALYRKVTAQVREGIHTNYFENGPRMERLDVTFANRYLHALDAYLTGNPCSRVWKLAFDEARSSKPLILQHLMLGMNAHINLDLGIAAAETCPGEDIHSLQGDFMKINDVLGSLVDEVRTEINTLSPWIGVLDNISPQASDAIANFSMKKARDAAWSFAQQLAPLSEEPFARACHFKDEEMTLLGELVAHPPGVLFGIGLWVIRLRESKQIVRNIEVLNQSASVAVPVEPSVAPNA